MKKAYLIFLLIVISSAINTACSNPVRQIASSYTSTQITENERSPEFTDGLFVRGVIKDISLNGELVAVVTVSGKGYLWGKNENGVIGDGTTQDVPSPYLIPLDVTFAQISASDYNTVAVTDTGAAYAWGGNQYGEYGRDIGEGSLVPQKISLDTAVSKFQTNGHISFLLTDEGEVFRSGWSFDPAAFELDEPDPARYSVPEFAKVELPAKVTDLFVAGSGAALLAESGEVYYVGMYRTVFGADTQDEFATIRFPVPVTKAAVSGGCLVALGTDRQLYGVGIESKGIFGADLNAALEQPAPIRGYESIKDFSLGANCLLAVTEKGTVLGSGYNIFNQVTDTQTTPADSDYISEPIEILLEGKVAKVFSGYVSSAAITEDGDCYIWGANYYNQPLFSEPPYTSAVPKKITVD